LGADVEHLLDELGKGNEPHMDENERMLDVTLEFIQELCEGHNLAAQNILREQASSSINVIGDLVDLLKSMVPTHLPDFSPILSQSAPSSMSYVFHSLEFR
jgi:hypothetical protein